MAQPDKMFLSTVYCWREKNAAIVKAGFFGIPGNDEKFLYNIDPSVNTIGADLTRGYKFVGTGNYAVLPETRIRVNVDEFFAGKLTGYAMRRVEGVMKMNVVNAQDGDRAVRLCSVLTFDVSDGDVEFGGLTFVKRPWVPKDKVDKIKKVEAKNSEVLKQRKDVEVTVAPNALPKQKREKNKVVSVAVEYSPPIVTKTTSGVERKRRTIADSESWASGNPTIEELQIASESITAYPTLEMPNGDPAAQLDSLLDNRQIVKAQVHDDSDSEGSDETSEDEGDRLGEAISAVRKPNYIIISSRMQQKLTESHYQGAVTAFSRVKDFIGCTNHTIFLNENNDIYLLEGIQISNPTTVYEMKGIPRVTFAFAKVE